MHASARVALRHLLVENPAPGRHPLNVAGAQLAAIAEAIAVVDRSGEHVGDGLDAAMGVPGETGTVVIGPIVAKIVEQEKGIELPGISESECTPQLHARAFDGGLGLDNAFDRPNGHEVFPLVQIGRSTKGRGKSPQMSVQGSPAFVLVFRFQRSYHFAARARTNVGTKGTLATI